MMNTLSGCCRPLISLLLLLLVCAACAVHGDTLYNGIVLPAEWPPKIDLHGPLPEPPYLQRPPDIIPIDVGRQLFVDDFLVEQTDMHRTYHHAELYPGNPVVRSDRDWENNQAITFSDGVWYDPVDRKFKMWYWADVRGKFYTCYAESDDGIKWRKPDVGLDIVPGSNVVNQNLKRNSSTVWLDLDDKNSAARFRMYHRGAGENVLDNATYTSPDGIHWSDPLVWGVSTGEMWVEDRTTMFYNPFRGKWVMSVRGVEEEAWDRRVRVRYYSEDSSWGKWNYQVPWTKVDELDLPAPEIGVRTQLYNLDCVAYESVLLGLFSVWHDHLTNQCKFNCVKTGFSRDGFYWYRPDRKSFIPYTRDKRVGNNVQSAGGCCLVVGDKLYFYVSADEDGPEARTALAMLRRDGFASMDAGSAEKTLTTRKMRFKGKYLFVNIDDPGGDLRVEALDSDGKVIKPFSKKNCGPVKVDKTLQAIGWKGAKDLSAVSGKVVRLKFYLKQGSLYSFWVSPDRSGASYGYVGAGGPGFTGSRDTVGTTPSLPPRVPHNVPHERT